MDLINIQGNNSIINGIIAGASGGIVAAAQLHMLNHAKLWLETLHTFACNRYYLRAARPPQFKRLSLEFIEDPSLSFQAECNLPNGFRTLRIAGSPFIFVFSVILGIIR